MKEINLKMQLRDDLTVKGESFDIPEPSFYIGQKVYVPRKEEEHPMDMKVCSIAAPLLEYTKLDDMPDVSDTPRWVYLVQYPHGYIPDIRYIEQQILTVDEHRELVQQAIFDDGVTLDEVAELHYQQNYQIAKEHIIMMWRFLEELKCDFNAADIKEVCRLYFTEFRKLVR